MSEHEIYAVKYGHNAERRASENFIDGDPHDAPMPMDYFVWVIKGPRNTYVLDTGFNAEMAQARKRELTRPIREGLLAVGVDPQHVRDVIISHMHYDHAGNHDAFPAARYHVQDREMAYCTGRCMCHQALKIPFEAEDVVAMVRKVFAGRVAFHDGSSEIEPGLSVHWVGGHSRGLQIVRVRTRRGWVVLATDASHYYANFEQRRPFPIVDSVSDMLEGYNRLYELAESPKHIIPGHDPLLLKRYPGVRSLKDIVRIDADPLDH